MNKIKHLLLLICIAGCFAACQKSTPIDNFDYAAQFTKDTTAIRAFVVKNNIPVIKDKSGVFYQVLTPGTGNVTYTANTKITADYEGRLLDGSIFDSSKGTPISFSLGQVIGGWQIAIPFIQPTGKIRFFVPSYYGYGNTSAGSIPPNSVLDFTVTLTNAL